MFIQDNSDKNTGRMTISSLCVPKLNTMFRTLANALKSFLISNNCKFRTAINNARRARYLHNLVLSGYYINSHSNSTLCIVSIFLHCSPYNSRIAMNLALRSLPDDIEKSQENHPSFSKSEKKKKTDGDEILRAISKTCWARLLTCSAALPNV